MDRQNNRIFKPTISEKMVVAFAFLPFQILLICFSFTTTYTYLLNNWEGFLFLGCIDLLILLLFLSIWTDKMEIISNAVIRTNLFKRQIIQIADIRYVKLQRGQKGTLWLVIKTNELLVSMGALGQKQINEAVGYILEQIRINYPENYENVKAGHNELENFWRKTEPNEVENFWRK